MESCLKYIAALLKCGEPLSSGKLEKLKTASERYQIELLGAVESVARWTDTAVTQSSTKKTSASSPRSEHFKWNSISLVKLKGQFARLTGLRTARNNAVSYEYTTQIT